MHELCLKKKRVIPEETGDVINYVSMCELLRTGNSFPDTKLKFDYFYAQSNPSNPSEELTRFVPDIEHLIIDDDTDILTLDIGETLPNLKSLEIQNAYSRQFSRRPKEININLDKDMDYLFIGSFKGPKPATLRINGHKIFNAVFKCDVLIIDGENEYLVKSQ